MLTIAICDDDAADRAKLQDMLKHFLDRRGINAKLFTYDNPDKLHLAVESRAPRFDIIFLDIIMGDTNGMAYARLLRRQDTRVKIIFLTSSTDYVYEGYEVNAAGYLVKPVKNDQVAKVMDKAIEQIADAGKDSLYVTSRGVTQRIPASDILYVESDNNKVNVVLAKTGAKIAVYTKLDAFEQTQPSKIFIRSHKSYLVNFLHIEKYAHDTFILTDGTVIPISRAYKDKVKQDFYTLLHSQESI